MKIQDVVPLAGAVANRVAGDGKAVKDSEPVDKVSVSEPVEGAASPDVVAEAMQAVTSQRSAHVEQIISAVKSGQYYPSPQQIAQQLVNAAEVSARLNAMLKG